MGRGYRGQLSALYRPYAVIRRSYSSGLQVEPGSTAHLCRVADSSQLPAPPHDPTGLEPVFRYQHVEAVRQIVCRFEPEPGATCRPIKHGGYTAIDTSPKHRNGRKAGVGPDVAPPLLMVSGHADPSSCAVVRSRRDLTQIASSCQRPRDRSSSSAGRKR